MKIEVLAAAGSTIIALAALGFSMFSFWAQRKEAAKLAAASVRPILKIRTQKYVNRKAIILSNRGLGPALIKHASFEKGGKTTNNVVELFSPIPMWDSYINVPDDTVLPPGDEFVLVAASASNLESNGETREQALATLERIEREQSGIKIDIKFENAHGIEQDTFSLVLK